jgi:branched-chain amino acid transport system ATP-binding protein
LEQPETTGGAATATEAAPGAQPAADLLTVTDLNAAYGKKQVVYNTSLHLRKGEAVAVLGHNGAGKTTVLKCIFGMVQPMSGQILLDGEDATRWSTSQSVHHGMAFIPSERAVFQDMNVADNLRLGGLTLPATVRGERIERAYEMFPVLRERASQIAGTLSGGEQRMVSLAMALMSEPRLLLLDEPSLGLAPILIQQFIDHVKKLVAEQGVSVVLVEQNVSSALRLVDRVYIMRAGRVFKELTAGEMTAMGREKWWSLF